MNFIKVVTIPLVPNGREYKLQRDISIQNATVLNVRTRKTGYSLNGARIANEVFDSAMLSLKVSGIVQIENLPLTIVESVTSNVIGEGFKLNMKDIDWASSILTIQNPSAIVTGTVIELVLELRNG